MQLKQRPLDSATVVAATPLPYTVPVDLVTRGFQFGLVGIAGWALYLCLRGGAQTPLWIRVPVGLFTFLAVWVQLRPSGLVIEEAGIRRTTLFILTRRLPWASIATVGTGAKNFNEEGAAIASLQAMDPSTAAYMTLIQLNDGQEPLLLNIKPYRMAGLRTLVHFILARAPQAQVDQTTREIIQGVVPPPYNGEARKKQG
jgi:hypothetical protein